MLITLIDITNVNDYDNEMLITGRNLSAGETRASQTEPQRDIKLV